MKNILGCLAMLGLVGCVHDREHAAYRRDPDRLVQHEIPYGMPEFGGRPEFYRPDDLR